MSDYLTHHGILGMKWGVRRYQNKDGTLTPSGKRRQSIIESSREEGIRVAKSKKQAQKKGEDVASALITAQRKAKTTGNVDKDFLNNPNISQKAKNKVLSSAEATKRKAKKSTKTETKTLSDEELRKVVNRLQMERQYSQLTSESVSKGKEYTQKVIKAGTTVAAVTTTALTIYNNVGKIKAILEKKG